MGGKFTEDHEIFRKTVRSFCENELAPHAEAWERDEIFPRSVFNRFGEMATSFSARGKRCSKVT